MSAGELFSVNGLCTLLFVAKWNTEQLLVNCLLCRFSWPFAGPFGWLPWHCGASRGSIVGDSVHSRSCLLLWLAFQFGSAAEAVRLAKLVRFTMLSRFECWLSCGLDEDRLSGDPKKESENCESSDLRWRLIRLRLLMIGVFVFCTWARFETLRFSSFTLVAPDSRCRRLFRYSKAPSSSLFLSDNLPEELFNDLSTRYFSENLSSRFSRFLAPSSGTSFRRSIRSDRISLIWRFRSPCFSRRNLISCSCRIISQRCLVLKMRSYHSLSKSKSLSYRYIAPSFRSMQRDLRWLPFSFSSIDCTSSSRLSLNWYFPIRDMKSDLLPFLKQSR